MRQAGQQNRFNDVELSLIKNLFAENEDLLFTLRKVLLQMDLSTAEKKAIKSLGDGAYQLLKKTFLPHLDPDAPFFQLADTRLSLTYDMKGNSVEGSWPLIQAKELEIAYLEQQFVFLEDVDKKIKAEINLAEMTQGLVEKGADRAFIEITARNYLLSFIDSNLNMLKMLAGLKRETIEETKKRLQHDSAK